MLRAEIRIPKERAVDFCFPLGESVAVAGETWGKKHIIL